MEKEFEHLKSIAWQPEHALFQLSPDKQYARHERYMVRNKGHEKDIVYEVEKAWNLRPYAQDDLYFYFH